MQQQANATGKDHFQMFAASFINNELLMLITDAVRITQLLKCIYLSNSC